MHGSDRGGWGSKFGTFLPLRTLTLDTADAERGQTKMQEMNICNNQDTITNKTHDKYILCIEEKWVKEAWSDWNRRFENRQSSVKWAVTKLNNAAHPFLRITPCYTPLVTAPQLKLFYAASSNWQLHCIYPARLNAPLRVIFQAILLKVRFWPVCAQDPCSRWVALHTSEYCGRRRWCKCYPVLIT